jgi:hypothetical protein
MESRVLSGVTLLLVVVVLVLETGATEPEPVRRLWAEYYFDNQRYIPQADSALVRARAQLTGYLGEIEIPPVKVYLVDDLERFERLIGGRFPEWGAAAALPARGMIVIKSPDRHRLGKSLTELVGHEYTHIVLAHKAAFAPIPRWFNEGLAMLVGMDWSWENNMAMSKAGAMGQFISLTEIDRVNSFTGPRAQLAYGQSYLAVRYLRENYGDSSLVRFVSTLAVGGSVDDALMAATGSTLSEFETEYHVFLTEHYNLVSLFTNTMLFWLFLALLVVVGFFVKYRQRRKYYEKWEEDEKLHSTDFDYGDPERPEQADHDDDVDYDDDVEYDDDDEPWRG